MQEKEWLSPLPALPREAESSEDREMCWRFPWAHTSHAEDFWSRQLGMVQSPSGDGGLLSERCW